MLISFDSISVSLQRDIDLKTDRTVCDKYIFRKHNSEEIASIIATDEIKLVATEEFTKAEKLVQDFILDFFNGMKSMYYYNR